MAIWYEVKRDEKSIHNFMECNWYFHDFRIEQITYIPGKDLVEVLLKYDTMKEGVILRFAGVHDLNVSLTEDYDVEWIFGSQLVMTDRETMIWVNNEDWDIKNPNELESIKKYCTFVEFELLIWAVTDENDKPIDLPDDRINQIWSRVGVDTKKHFELDEFTDDWEKILRPYYMRFEV